MLHSNAQGQAANLYMGSFLKGCNLSAFGIEFEEWAYRLRSALAESLRNGLLQQAEALCTSLRLDDASSLAERAYLLPGADEPEPEMLLRLHSIFTAANHPLEADVRAEAMRFGLSALPAEQHPAMTGLRPGDGSAAKGNLPLPLDSFIGRDSEIAELLSLLRRNDVRLVTLQGAGGAGKSQLALEVARQLTADIRFSDGVYLVALEAVPDHGLIPMVIANTLGMTLQGSAPPLEQLKTYLGSKQLLLVLDNFEHLVEAADMTSSLLAFRPGLKLIVTSRERLDTQPEHPLTVDGLRYPEQDAGLDTALTYGAVQLLLARAQKYDRDFRVSEENLSAVLRICEALSGLPLGLELAATWTEHMSVEEIADEVERAPADLETSFRDAPDRHRSLRATLNQTWELLTDAERIVLREVAVFRGGFRHDAARAVLDATLPELASLVHKSLLRLSSRRYSPHPLLHQHAREQLELEPERLAELREKHARHYLWFLSETTDTILSGTGVRAAVSKLEEEQANIGAAWRWALELRQHDELVAAVESLTHFAEVRSAQVWVRTLFLAALETLTEENPAARHLSATMKGTLPILMYRIDDNALGLQHALEAASELRTADLKLRNPGLWAAHYGTGLTRMLLGDYDSERFDEAVQLARDDLERSASPAAGPGAEGRSEALLAIALIGAAMSLVLEGDLKRAQDYLDQARPCLHSMRSPYASYFCWVQHDTCLADGRPAEAEQWAREGHELAQRHRYVTQEARLALCLARLKFLAGDAPAAQHHTARVNELITLSDDGFVRSPLQTLEGWMALAGKRPDKAMTSFMAAIESGSSINVRINILEPLFGLSQIFLQADRTAQACRIVGFLAETPMLPAALRPSVQETAAQMEASGREAHGWLAEGRAMGLEQVLMQLHG